MTGCARRAVALWLEFAKAEDVTVTSQAQAEDLLRHDRALYGFAWKDPDNEVKDICADCYMHLSDDCDVQHPAISYLEGSSIVQMLVQNVETCLYETESCHIDRRGLPAGNAAAVNQRHQHPERGIALGQHGHK